MCNAARRDLDAFAEESLRLLLDGVAATGQESKAHAAFEDQKLIGRAGNRVHRLPRDVTVRYFNQYVRLRATAVY